MADKNIDPEETADTSTLQKKRARRRLVGAAALALLAVIVLPMVMDHEPRPATQDIQVRIPSQDTVAPAKKAVAAKPVEVVPAPVSADAKPTANVPVAEAKPPEVAVAKPEAKPEPKPEPKVEAKAEVKTDNKAELARAERALNGASSEQWLLQLGAYQDSGNVKALQAKIKELGYASYTEKVDTPAGVRIRVRAGPFASQAAAAAAQARLKKIGAGGPPGGVIAKK